MDMTRTPPTVRTPRGPARRGRSFSATPEVMASYASTAAANCSASAGSDDTSGCKDRASLRNADLHVSKSSVGDTPRTDHGSSPDRLPGNAAKCRRTRSKGLSITHKLFTAKTFLLFFPPSRVSEQLRVCLSVVVKNFTVNNAPTTQIRSARRSRPHLLGKICRKPTAYVTAVLRCTRSYGPFAALDVLPAACHGLA